MLGELTMLEESGVDVKPCGTCLQHYGVEPAVGSVGSMDGIVKALGDAAEKVIRIRSGAAAAEGPGAPRSNPKVPRASGSRLPWRRPSRWLLNVAPEFLAGAV